MTDPEPHPPDTAKKSPPTAPLFGRYDILMCVPLAFGMLTALGLLLASTVFRNLGADAATLEELRRTVIPEVFQGLAPEPLERALFASLNVLGPFCILAALLLVRRVRAIVPAMNRAPEYALGIASLGWVWAALALIHGKSLLQFYFFPDPLVDLLSLIAGAAVLFWMTRAHLRNEPLQNGSGGSRLSVALGVPRLVANKRVPFWVLAGIAAFIVFLPRGLSVHTALGEDPEILARSCWGIHFQASMYALTQVVAGKPLLAAAPPLYGCYAAFLAPIFQVIGLSLFKLTMVLSALLLAAHVSVLAVARRHIRTRPLMLLFCAALFYTMALWHFGRQPFDVFFQYWPIRYLFPALSVPLFMAVSRRATPASVAGLGLVCGLALVWNLETGIAVTGATLFTFALEALGTWIRRKRGSGVPPLSSPWKLPLAGVSAGLTVALCYWLLWRQTGGVHPLHSTGDYQRLFYVSGATMLPLPLTPHPWYLVQLVYLTALASGISGLVLQGRAKAWSRLAAYLAVLGEGLFTYYQGRSHDFNLTCVAWPAILLGFLMADRLVRAIRAGLLSPHLRWVALPATYYGAMSSLMICAVLPGLLKQGTERWCKTLASAPDPLVEHVDFIRRHTGVDHDCVILAPMQAAYFAETGFRSQYDSPGYSELCFLSDVDALKKALVEKPARHLFTETKILELFHLEKIVGTHYRLVATTPDQKLSYLEPQTGSDLGQ